MPAYALLGATGSTGSNIVRQICEQPDKELRCLVRSRSKLEKQLPDPPPSNIIIHGGSLADTDLLVDILRGTRAVLIALGPPGNQPGCRILQDTIATLIAALRVLRASAPDAKLPRIVLLSAATLDDAIAHPPWPIHQLVSTAVFHIYADLRVAERMLRAESGWLVWTFVRPAALVHDRRRGHALGVGTTQALLSFADLAAAMLEVADADGDRWDQQCPGVTSETVAWTWNAVATPKALLLGLVEYYFPWTYEWLH
jgi:putative NADH-flavin reductase